MNQIGRFGYRMLLGLYSDGLSVMSTEETANDLHPALLHGD